MHALAAAPELYPQVVKLGSLASIIQLLLHENPGTQLWRTASPQTLSSTLCYRYDNTWKLFDSAKRSHLSHFTFCSDRP